MTEETIQSAESGISGVLRVVCIVGALLTLGALLMGGPRIMLAAAIGATAAVLNLWVIGRLVASFLSGHGRMSWGFVATVKLLVLFGGMYLLVRSGVVSAIPLAIGYGALPLGIVAAQLGGVSTAREEGSRHA